MTKPETYPFLRIAKRFDVDYSDVLLAADFATHQARELPGADGAIQNLPTAVLHEIGRAVGVQEQIRNGQIDWMTGEPL